MTWRFNPFRCLSKWFLIPWLLLLFFGFWLGRWFCVGVRVVAVRGDDRIHAQVLLPSGKLVGQTPCRVRGFAGDRVRLTLKHEGRTLARDWLITRERPVCLVEFPSRKVALIFVAYDTDGREIEAVVEGPRIPRHTTVQRSRLTETIGDKVKLTFRPRDPRYGPGREETIVWHDKEGFDNWLDERLPRILAARDPDYDVEAWNALRARLKRFNSDAAHDYPVIFRAPRP